MLACKMITECNIMNPPLTSTT